MGRHHSGFRTHDRIGSDVGKSPVKATEPCFPSSKGESSVSSDLVSASQGNRLQPPAGLQGGGPFAGVAGRPSWDSTLNNLIPVDFCRQASEERSEACLQAQTEHLHCCWILFLIRKSDQHPRREMPLQVTGGAR